MRIYYEKKGKPVTAGEVLALHRLAKEGKLNAFQTGVWMDPPSPTMHYVGRIAPMYLAQLLHCRHRRPDGGPCAECLRNEIRCSDLEEKTKEQMMEAEDP